MKALVADQECVPAESEVRKRPRMALTNFLKLGKRKECVGCSHALLQAICTYTDRLRHGVSKYLLHIHTCLHTLHEFSASTYTIERFTIETLASCRFHTFHLVSCNDNYGDNEDDDDNDEGWMDTQEVVALGWGSCLGHCFLVKC